MSESPKSSEPNDELEQQAAAWVLRSDRGLSPTEQDEFSAWLAADPAHGAQLARHRRHWRRLDALAEWRPEHAARPNPDLLAPPLRMRMQRWQRPAFAILAAAAAVAFAIFLARPRAPHADAPSTSPVAAKSVSGPRVLPDGTIVEVNRDAEFSVHFTATERRVRLERGEAHFFVTKNPNRPFIVSAAGVDVRAVGTAFNVRIDPAAVEVLVTEGSVRLDATQPGAAAAPGATAAPVPPLIPVLEARQRAVIPVQPARQPQPKAPEIATLTSSEIERVLAWQHRLLDFNATPLNEIVAEFNRRNVVQLVVIDPELSVIPISATIRSDNIEGFVSFLETGFGARAEKRGGTEILLRKAK